MYIIYIHICFIKIFPSESKPHSTRFVSKKSATLPAISCFFRLISHGFPFARLTRYEVLEGYCEPNSFTDTLCSASSSVPAQAPVADRWFASESTGVRFNIAIGCH